MPFWHFSQNNSGGRFVFEPENGISHHVVIEAMNAREARVRAQDIGLYFDGVRSGMDCSCCGDRWSEPWMDDDGKAEPAVYGHDVSKLPKAMPRESIGIKWIKGGPEGYVHFLDGTFKPFWTEKPRKS